MLSQSNKEKIEKRKVSSGSNILSALKQMDINGKKMLFVYEGEKFLNILSIGDIQRAIINNNPMDTPIAEILRNNTLLAKEGDSIERIKAKMFEIRAECMPIIDNNNQLIDVIFWEDVFSEHEIQIKHNLNLPVIIMAGGRGTRLQPITNILPKPLIPIGKKTIIEEIMDRFLNVGCSNFYISINYKAEMIKYYFKTLNSPNYHIQYFQENEPLGTAGSLHLLKGKIKQTFFVSNCDIIIEEDFNEIYNYHKNNENEITLVAALKHYKIPYGTIETKDDGLLTSLSEKPEMTFKINSGMYILEHELLNEIPENQFFHITELIEKVRKRNGKVGVFPVSEKSWKDIGDWDEYLSNAQI